MLAPTLEWSNRSSARWSGFPRNQTSNFLQILTPWESRSQNWLFYVAGRRTSPSQSLLLWPFPCVSSDTHLKQHNCKVIDPDWLVSKSEKALLALPRFPQFCAHFSADVLHRLLQESGGLGLDHDTQELWRHMGPCSSSCRELGVPTKIIFTFF